MSIVFKNECASCIDTPLCNKTTMYVDNCDGAVKVIDNSGCVNTISCAADLVSLAECCDVPTNNNQLSNGCGYFKGFGLNTLVCRIEGRGVCSGCICFNGPAIVYTLQGGTAPDKGCVYLYRGGTLAGSYPLVGYIGGVIAGDCIKFCGCGANQYNNPDFCLFKIPLN